MAETNCSKLIFRSRSEAESCQAIAELKTGEPHIVSTNSMIEPGDEITWSVVKFTNCHDGAIFESRGTMTTLGYASSCAESLQRISRGLKSCRAVLFKETGWFSSDHYQTKCD